MRHKLTSLKMLLASSLLLPAVAFGQEEPDRVVDEMWMEYFDEAYSVYLDATNRTAGLKNLTADEVAGQWFAANSTQDVVTINNDVMTIEHTKNTNGDNYRDISLMTTGWANEGASPFAHIAGHEGGDVMLMGGQFVDMTLDGQVTVSFQARTDIDCELRIDLVDANGRQGNGKAQSEYQNTQRASLYAEDGWTTFYMIWESELFDYYSGAYWGQSNGMWDNKGSVINGTYFGEEDPVEGASVWAYDMYGDLVRQEIEMETVIPVDNRTISKIMMIIDDASQGEIGVTKTVEIKDLVIGSVDNAVDYIPFTEENRIYGNIDFNEENIVQVRAREEIYWPTEPILNGGSGSITNAEVTIINELSDIYIYEDYNYIDFDLADYFTSSETLSYSYEMYTDDVNMNETHLYESFLSLTDHYYTTDYWESMNVEPYVCSVTFVVTATNTSGSSAIQTFSVIHYPQEGGTVITPANKAPYQVKPINSLVLEQGFGSKSLNLNGYFADPDGDDLEYSIYYDYYYSSVTFDMPEGIATPIFSIEEYSTGLTTAAIGVSDGEHFIDVLFDVYVSSSDIREVPITDKLELIYVDEGTASIELSEYISPEENLTFTVSGESFPSQTLDLQQATALTTYEVTAKDQFGRKTNYTAVVAFEQASGSVYTYGIPDVYIESGMEAINLSYYFSGNNLTYSIAAAGNDVGTIYLDNGMLIIEPSVGGTTEVTVMAKDIYGGYAVESFSVISLLSEIAEKQLPADITVYPTIVTDHVTVENAQGSRLIISDLYGHVLVNKLITETKENVDVSALLPGTYAIVAGWQSFKIVKE